MQIGGLHGGRQIFMRNEISEKFLSLGFEEKLLVALVGGDSIRRNDFRQKLDNLGFASLAFESISQLENRQGNSCEFGCLIIILAEDQIQSGIQIAIEKREAPVLLVTVDEGRPAFLIVDKPIVNSRKIAALHESCSGCELNSELQLLTGNRLRQLNDSPFYILGNYRFNAKRRQVWIGEKKISLRPLEFELALELFRNINSTLTREKLYSQIWGGGESETSQRSRTLDVCICGARKKMRLLENGFLLKSLYGKGYELCSMNPEGKRTGQAVQLASLASYAKLKFL